MRFDTRDLSKGGENFRGDTVGPFYMPTLSPYPPTLLDARFNCPDGRYFVQRADISAQMGDIPAQMAGAPALMTDSTARVWVDIVIHIAPPALGNACK